jgi:hypothetical protein
MNIELVSLDEVAAQADFLTLHVAKTPETIGLIGRDFLAKAKPSCGSSTWPGAASSTRPPWPTPSARARSPAPPSTCSPNRAHHRVAAVRASRRWSSPPTSGPAPVRPRTRPATPSPSRSALALAGEFVPFAVNVAAAEASETVRPFLNVAEQLGRSSPGCRATSARPRSRSSTRASSPATTPASSPCRCSRASSGTTDEPGLLRERPADRDGEGRRLRVGHLVQRRLDQPGQHLGRRPPDRRHARRPARPRPASCRSTATRRRPAAGQPAGGATTTARA